jgi:hypothetical protein
MSDPSEFYCGEEYGEEEETCDYNGEQCIGDKLFCEECPVITGDWGQCSLVADRNPFCIDVSLVWLFEAL